MLQQQKQTLLSLLKISDNAKDYTNHYLVPYQDFFDLHDDFTDFQCERTAGKARYLILIEQLLRADQTARVFVEVNSFEQDASDISVCADTLIILSKLPLFTIRQLFDVPDIFPSGIGQINDLKEKYTVICGNAALCPISDSLKTRHTACFCWWD